MFHHGNLKGLSNESVKQPTTSDNSLTPELDYGTKRKRKFTGSCLKQVIFLLIKKL